MNFFLKTLVVTSCFCSHIFASQTPNLLSCYTPREIEAYHATAASRNLRLKSLRQREAMRTQKNTILSFYSYSSSSSSSSSSSDGSTNKNSQRPTSISSSSVEECLLSFEDTSSSSEESSSSFEEVYSEKEIMKVIERLASSGTTIIATSYNSSSVGDATAAKVQQHTIEQELKKTNSENKQLVNADQAKKNVSKQPTNNTNNGRNFKAELAAKRQVFLKYGVKTEQELKNYFKIMAYRTEQLSFTEYINQQYYFVYLAPTETFIIKPNNSTIS